MKLESLIEILQNVPIEGKEREVEVWDRDKNICLPIEEVQVRLRSDVVMILTKDILKED